MIKLSQALSALGDHSTDIFSTVRNLQLLVSALSSSSDLLASFNNNLADISTVLSNTPGEVADATTSLDGAVDDLSGFVAENREGLGVAFDRLASVTTALNDSRGDIKQVLHITPTVFQNFMNIYQPAQSSVTGILAPVNFANTVQFVCSAIESASRQGSTIGETLRTVSGADHQESPVQLPATRCQSVRGSDGAAQRDHLQRGPAEPEPGAARACDHATAQTRYCRQKRRCAATPHPTDPVRVCRA